MAQFRELMSDIVGRAIAQNNEELSLSISQEVRETVLKEMNYLFREQEESQEERYRKLDARNPQQTPQKTLAFFPERQVQKGFKSQRRCRAYYITSSTTA